MDAAHRPMRLDLDGRAFVVCGASRGLGRATAHELVAHGARVLLAARRPQEVATELGDAAVPLPVDLTAPDAAERVAAGVRESFAGRLDGILVNGGGPPAGRALEYTDEQWSGAFELLLGGPIRLLRELTPMMAGGGSVVIVTSSSVRQPIDGLDTSNVLRPAVAALAKVLARELGPAIRVNSLAPGRFDTDRVRDLDAQRAGGGGDVEAVRARNAAAIPLRRYGDPRELARVAAFLLSDAASYVSGAALQVDGAAVTAVP
ncbi:MAG: 3-oxoacyl-[acyl-carrier protein] reductase [uncultured Solirubrobacteraceae bacterium]|uniref:3-oxoacyl-[acyl-carrier protein] reductase n=1 Tax=uncultured Solirubrobacteraceae bacterium TaxID=1162706 RepID=A0A6J4RBG9_9ACTN|nr:MAG: 3-oxoacyl-[acyl-carrier protein] reductase [uncultured Solirubrobacteraceae bacterium]